MNFEHIVITDSTGTEPTRVVVARKNGDTFDVIASIPYRNASTHYGRLLEARTIAAALDTLTPVDYDRARHA